MLTVLYVVALFGVVFWVGLYLGKHYPKSKEQVSPELPPSARVLHEGRPPRRTERVNISVPIFVTGEDTSGEKFEKSAHTVTLSGHGASIDLSHRLSAGQDITIQRLDKSRQAIARVLHTIARSEKGNLYGVAFVDPAVDLWGMCKLLTEAQEDAVARDAAERESGL
jgi:hypothetical protein